MSRTELDTRECVTCLRSGQRPRPGTGHQSPLVGRWVAAGHKQLSTGSWLVPAPPSSDDMSGTQTRHKLGIIPSSSQDYAHTDIYRGGLPFVVQMNTTECVNIYSWVLYLLPKGLWPSLTRGCPGRKPWLGGREPGAGGGAWSPPGCPHCPLVTTDPPGPNVVCTGVLGPCQYLQFSQTI